MLYFYIEYSAFTILNHKIIFKYFYIPTRFLYLKFEYHLSSGIFIIKYPYININHKMVTRSFIQNQSSQIDLCLVESELNISKALFLQ